MSGLEAPAGEFAFTRLEKVVFGPGCIQQLAGELEARGLERVVIATGRSLGASPLLQQVVDATGGRCVGLFTGCAQHVPMHTVRELTVLLLHTEADAVISFGGGSPIDTAKVAAASVMNGRDMTLEAGTLELGAAFRGRAGGGPEIVHIAVPTTLSAGEYTPGGGATDEASKVKRATLDPRLQAKLVINDPELTLATPDWLWVSTGMRALDHAVEAAYSVRRQPFVDALAAKAIRLLTDHLPGSIRAEGAERIAHRGQCQTAAWCSLFGGFNTGLGISHAIGHQVGPAFEVPHGVTSCISLPHAMRFMAQEAPERFGPIAEGLGLAFDAADPGSGARACTEQVAGFIAGFDVPLTLQAVGVSHNELPRIAEAVQHEIERFAVLGRPMRLEEAQGLLEAAWRG